MQRALMRENGVAAGDPSDCAIGNQLLCLTENRVKLIRHQHTQFSGAFCGFQHLLCVRGRSGKRLFYDYVFPGLHALNGDGRMAGVIGGHNHRIDFRNSQQGLQAVFRLRSQLLRRALAHLRIAIINRVDLELFFSMTDGIQIPDMGNITAANHGH